MDEKLPLELLGLGEHDGRTTEGAAGFDDGALDALGSEMLGALAQVRESLWLEVAQMLSSDIPDQLSAIPVSEL
jgi:hypothetical protein